MQLPQKTVIAGTGQDYFSEGLQGRTNALLETGHG